MSTTTGDAAPSFRLPTTDGGEITLGELAGAPAVVAFWCNHCPYVRAWEERLNDIAREYADRGVTTVAICSNDATSHPGDSFENMIVRAAEGRYTFAYAHDASQEVAQAFGAQRTPDVFVLDGGGRVTYRGAIDDSVEPEDVEAAYLRDALDAALDDRVPAVAETPPVGCTIKWSR